MSETIKSAFPTMTASIDREALKRRLMEKQGRLKPDAPEPVAVASGVTNDKPVITSPATLPDAGKLAPARPKFKLAPTTVTVNLSLVDAADRQALGACYTADTRQTGGRVITVKLFRDQPLISNAIQRLDEYTIRWAASLLLVEFLLYSRPGNLPEIRRLGDALRKALGGPWRFVDNLTFLTCELARHEMSDVGKLGLFTADPKKLWLTLEANLETPSTLFRWNADLPVPARKHKPKAATPQGDKL